MKEDTKDQMIWVILFGVIIVVDILMITLRGHKSTLSYTVFRHRDFLFIPYAVGVVVGHFFIDFINIPFKDKVKYVLWISFSVIVLAISFFVTFNAIIPLVTGIIIGGTFWRQYKIK